MDKAKFNPLNVWKQNNLQSLLRDSKFADFFKWFENNVTEENILIAEEIEICDELNESGTFIDVPDEISKKLMEHGLETQYSGYELESLQDELNDHRESEAFLNDLVVSNRATELKLDDELRQLKSKMQSQEKNTQSMIEECKVNAKTLEELQAKNLKSLTNLKDCYYSYSQAPLFFCKLNLSEYCLSCEKFGLNLKIRADEKMKLAHFVDQSEDETLKILFDLSNINKKACKKTVEKLTTEGDISVVNHLIGILSGRFFEPMTYSQMMEQTERMSYTNEDMNENNEHLRMTMKEKIEEFALQEAKFCELEGNKEKLLNAKSRLEILKRLQEPLMNGLLVSEVLWILLQMEMEKIKTVLEKISVDRYKYENKRSIRNMEILKSVSTAPDSRVAETFLIQFSDIIMESVAPQSCLDNCIEEYNKSVSNNVVQLRNIVSDLYRIDIQTIINDFNSHSQRMSEFIGDGPLNKPNLWNLSVVADSEVQKHTAEFQKNFLRELRSKYVDGYHNPAMNDELWKRRQYLWIWFLTDETQFLEALTKTTAEFKKCQQLKVVQNTPQVVGGLRRQQ